MPRTIIDETIEAMRRKQAAFGRLDELRKHHQRQKAEYMRLRDIEQRWIDMILEMGLEDEWIQRVRKELP